jgi:hypothetical protein
MELKRIRPTRRIYIQASFTLSESLMPRIGKSYVRIPRIYTKLTINTRINFSVSCPLRLPQTEEHLLPNYK